LEAISCGLPVVTLPGRFMRGRHAYAMLKMMGLTETIARDKSAYCQIAASLANDSAIYKRTQERFIENGHMLFEDKTYIRFLENFLVSRVLPTTHRSRLINEQPLKTSCNAGHPC
jgi:predicted O-linked N-acetylglucosamine transferase (SPINDLY family)